MTLYEHESALKVYCRGAISRNDIRSAISIASDYRNAAYIGEETAVSVDFSQII